MVTKKGTESMEVHRIQIFSEFLIQKIMSGCERNPVRFPRQMKVAEVPVSGPWEID